MIKNPYPNEHGFVRQHDCWQEGAQAVIEAIENECERDGDCYHLDRDKLRAWWQQLKQEAIVPKGE